MGGMTTPGNMTIGEQFNQTGKLPDMNQVSSIVNNDLQALLAAGEEYDPSGME